MEFQLVVFIVFLGLFFKVLSLVFKSWFFGTASVVILLIGAGAILTQGIQIVDGKTGSYNLQNIDTSNSHINGTISSTSTIAYRTKKDYLVNGLGLAMLLISGLFGYLVARDTGIVGNKARGSY